MFGISEALAGSGERRSSCAMTAAYSRSISSCLLCLSASITFASKLTTLPTSGETALLVPLRTLPGKLLLVLFLRGEYQPRLLTGLMGLGSKAVFIGFTISVPRIVVAMLSALLRSLRPTVRSNVLIMITLPI